jgi:hypothetical protein
MTADSRIVFIMSPTAGILAFPRTSVKGDFVVSDALAPNKSSSSQEMRQEMQKMDRI